MVVDRSAKLRALRTFALACALTAFAALSAACVKKPVIAVQSAKISGVQVSVPLELAVQLQVQLVVDNPNGFDVKVRHATGKVVLLDAHEVPFQLSPDAWLRAHERTPLTIPVSVPLKTAIAVVRGSISRAEIPFRITGEIDLTATSSLEIEKNHYPFDARGEIPRSVIVDAVRKVVRKHLP
jgi:hypothetical protein